MCMGGGKSKETVCISHILGIPKSIAQPNIHTTLIQPRSLIYSAREKKNKLEGVIPFKRAITFLFIA